MILDTPEFASLFTRAICHLITLFKENNYEIRIAGGAVRDLLLGNTPKDIDFATTATPDQMNCMFENRGIKTFNNKGEKHGTVTARIFQENFEITTLRIDVVTDGRHAEVEFTTDWKLDASRRDLTINSMFLGVDGTLYDYFNGYEDLKNRRVAFVGDAETRIQEDYLRILRYFRFYGRIADKPDCHEEKTLWIVENNRHGLVQISGERIWMELRKIISGNHHGALLHTMIKCKLHPMLGLPDFPDLEEFDKVINTTNGVECNPVVIIAALMKTEEHMMAFHARCKLSCFERDLGMFIVMNRKMENATEMNYKKLILSTRAKTISVIEWAKELMKYRGDFELIPTLSDWIVPRMPVTGAMLTNQGCQAGKTMGMILEKLTTLWLDSDFKMTSEQLLEHLPEIKAEIEQFKKDRSPPAKKKK